VFFTGEPGSGVNGFPANTGGVWAVDRIRILQACGVFTHTPFFLAPPGLDGESWGKERYFTVRVPGERVDAEGRAL